MSTIYHTEPPTQGKVLLHTTFGDVDIELWAKEAPLACRNFIQLILENYYNNTIIHRIIKGFMIQMGDPSGTGLGGKSIWNRPFKDEFHSRLKFNHRGQLAMANNNSPNSNQSQFFITLDACEWLNNKHTVFGKVTGNTIFNLLRIGDVEVDSNDKPFEEFRIKSIEVLWNPFDDIIPRDLSGVVGVNNNRTSNDKIKSNETNRKAVKDKKLLSFATEEEEEIDSVLVLNNIRMKSSHDSSSKQQSSFKSKKNIKANTITIQEEEEVSNHHRVVLVKEVTHSSSDLLSTKSVASNSILQEKNDDDDDNYDDDQFDKMMKLKLLKQKDDSTNLQHVNQGITTTYNTTGILLDDDEEDGLPLGLDKQSIQTTISNHDKRRNNSELKEKSEEYRKLKESLLRSRKAVNVMMGTEAEKLQIESAYKELVTPLEQRRLKYIKRKNNHGDRSEETMEKLRKFTNTIRDIKHTEDNKLIQTKEVEASTVGVGLTTTVDNSYHGQVLEEDEYVSSNNSNSKGIEIQEMKTWFVGKLKCKKHIDDKYRDQINNSGSDGRNIDDYAVIDPRK